VVHDVVCFLFCQGDAAGASASIGDLRPWTNVSICCIREQGEVVRGYTGAGEGGWEAQTHRWSPNLSGIGRGCGGSRREIVAARWRNRSRKEGEKGEGPGDFIGVVRR
jgi:hypothetical protein